MATNADFNTLIARITTATNTLEADVLTITEGSTDIAEAVAAAQLAETNAETAASSATAQVPLAAAQVTLAANQVTLAAGQVALATTQANTASSAATTATTQANRAQNIADNLLATAPFQEAPKDGNVYGRKDGSWSVVTGGGGSGTVKSVNNVEPDVGGNITLTASDVGAKPASYVPTWTEVTGKPATFPPTIGTTADTALAGNTVIPTNTNQLTNGAKFVTATTAPVRSVAGKAGVVVLEAADIASGVMATARLGTGTANATTVLLGNGTWGSAPASTGGFALEVSDFYVNNVLTTTWPTANPNTPIVLNNCTRKPGGGAVSVTGGGFLTNADNRAYLPDGVYAFNGQTFPSGHPLTGRIGIIHKYTGSNGIVVEAFAPVFGGSKATAWTQDLVSATFMVLAQQA